MSRSLKTALFVALLVFAAALRLWGLDHDPPAYDVLPDAAPWTDEGTIGVPALRAAEGQITLSQALSDGVRPLHRLLLYGAFKLVEPARLAGRLLSVLVGVLGLLGLAALGGTIWPSVGPLLVLLLAGTGFFFVAYDRLLLTEGPLLALLALLTLAGLRIRSSRWAALAVGAGVSLLAVGFKLHALALAPALAALYGLRRRRLFLPFLAGLALVLAAWRLMLIPTSAPQYLNYLDDRVAGQRFGLVGFGPALLQVFEAGLPADYLTYQWPVLLLAVFECLAFLLSPRRWLREANDTTLVALVWLAAAMVGAGVFRYLPPRYFHMASAALLLVALAGAYRFTMALPLPRAPAWTLILVSLVTTAFLLGQLVGPLAYLNTAAFAEPLLGLPSLVAFIVALAAGRTWSQRGRSAFLGGLLVCQVAVQGGLYSAGILQTQPALARIAATLAVTLPPDAVVTGRLAGTMALAAPQLDGVPMLDNISLRSVETMVAQGPVWVLILRGDGPRVASEIKPYLVLEESFPVDYSRYQRSVEVYRFDMAQAGLACGGPGKPSCPPRARRDRPIEAAPGCGHGHST